MMINIWPHLTLFLPLLPHVYCFLLASNRAYLLFSLGRQPCQWWRTVVKITIYNVFYLDHTHLNHKVENS